MTPDPASQAVHERLEAAVASMPAFDVEAGWSAFVAELEPPLATVIPLRRRRPHRAIVLGVAAALVIGGSAFAAVRYGDATPLSVVPPVTGPGSGLVVGPHVHGAFSGAPFTPNGGSDPNPAGGSGSGADDQGTGDTTGGTGGNGGGTDGAGSSTGASSHDSPDDIDHGSGNDGQHDDNGGGNDAEGQDPGQGSGGGDSSGGSGDEGSNAQGSNDQGGQGNSQ